MFLERAKTRRLCFRKIIGSNDSLTLIEKKNQVFEMEFAFKVTVPYSLWAKCTPLWPLKDNQETLKIDKQHEYIV